MLPAPSPGQQAGPLPPRGGSPHAAGGGLPAAGEEETRPPVAPQERAQGQGPLLRGHERAGD